MSESCCMFSVMLTKHDSELLRQSKSRNMNVFIEKRIVVTEHSISSSRFDLEFKVNTEFPTNWQVSVIDEVALSMK